MFLRNGWYAASWSGDLTGQPVGRTLLGEQVVLFRTESGRAAALEDRCCHRGAPLSRGEGIGERIQCGYHGLQFDTAGNCVLVPGQVRIPPGAQVRSYPVHEKWNVVWIWMGDPARADTADIPELFWLDDPGWTPTPGYLYLNANYLLVADNLLDLTHVTYVHRNTLAGDPREATAPTKTERLSDGVRVGRWMIDYSPPPLFARAGRFETNVDRWQFVTWTLPGTVFLDVGCAKTGTGAPEGDRSQGISIWSTHLLTPESETSSHYFFCYARNFALDDPDMSKLLFDGSKATFLEDVAMIEAQQQNLRGGALERLIDINADTAQLQARRMLEEKIRAEQMLATAASA